MFIMTLLIDFLKHSNQKLYCAFIDFSKAFDNVWRVGLWSKLYKNDINGRFLTLVQNMYKNIKSCVQLDDDISDFFPSYAGVRQGENLSPLLFCMYLNDLEQWMERCKCEGVDIPLLKEEGLMYINLLLLLYADDTVLFATSPKKLQHSLNVFKNYCDKWKLKINIDKTKIVVFGSGRRRVNKFSFSIEEKLAGSLKFL